MRNATLSKMKLWKEIGENHFEAHVILDKPSVNGVICCDFSRRFRIVAMPNSHRTLYLLLAAINSVRVNGQFVMGGLRVLDHKDEIFDGTNRYYFSSESKPEIDVYRSDGQTRKIRCPVCRAPINEGEQVVFCPGCKRVFHQIGASASQSERPCWTYSPTCQFCKHPTSLTGEAAWRPEKEGL